MSNSTQEFCGANRVIVIDEEHHGNAATDVVIRSADGQQPVGSGIIGNIIWQRSYDEKARTWSRIIGRLNDCKRCVGQPTRACDSDIENLDDRGPQPLPATPPATASSAQVSNT